MSAARKMVDRGRIELPTPGFSVPCIGLSWHGLPDSGPQTGTQWVHPLHPASSRLLRAWIREVGDHGWVLTASLYAEEGLVGVSALSKLKHGFESPRGHHKSACEFVEVRRDLQTPPPRRPDLRPEPHLSVDVPQQRLSAHH